MANSLPPPTPLPITHSFPNPSHHRQPRREKIHPPNRSNPINVAYPPSPRLHRLSLSSSSTLPYWSPYSILRLDSLQRAPAMAEDEKRATTAAPVVVPNDSGPRLAADEAIAVKSEVSSNSVRYLHKPSSLCDAFFLMGSWRRCFLFGRFQIPLRLPLHPDPVYDSTLITQTFNRNHSHTTKTIAICRNRLPPNMTLTLQKMTFSRPRNSHRNTHSKKSATL